MLRCFSRCHRTCEVVSAYGIGESFGDSLSPADELGPWRTGPTRGSLTTHLVLKCITNIRIFSMRGGNQGGRAA